MNNRIQKLNEYPFSRLKKLICGTETGLLTPEIDFSIGEPKTERPKFVEKILKDNIADISRYPSAKGITELRASIADWATQRYSLNNCYLDHEKHILPASGTRESLFGISQALYKDDPSKPYIGMPNPFYQIYEGAAILAGATPIYINQLNTSHGHLKLNNIGRNDWIKIQMIYICTPANPSGETYSLKDFDSIMQIAKEHNIIVVSDECYSEIYRPSSKPPVGLLEWCEKRGERNFSNCIVMNSLSKRSGLPGLRSGFIAGDELLISSFSRYRSYQGVAMPFHVQKASSAAWSDEEHVSQNRSYYSKNFHAANEILGDLPFYEEPKAGFFIWLKIPTCDRKFTKNLYDAHKILVMPGTFLARESFDMNPGLNYIRIALVHNQKKCIKGLEKIRNYLVEQ